MKLLRWKWLLVVGFVATTTYAILLGILATREWVARREFLVGEMIPHLAMGETPSVETSRPSRLSSECRR